MCQNCDAESGDPTSPSLLEEDDPGPLSSQQQATSSRDKKPLSSLHLSHRAQVALEYLPFFCTYGCLLEEEGLVLQPETLLQEDSELLSGFFPYYRSEEESLPSLALPGWSHRGSQDLPTEKEARAGCFCRTTVRDECSTLTGPWISPSQGCCGPWRKVSLVGSTDTAGRLSCSSPA
ncbi:T0092965 isoform 1 [Pan troglodytes]|uniref:T0092965 isoform 1 n=1 Tax=Pan troglodytes TaxID=9598 RepID=A0A2J8LRK2_PANTR|nr:T0092965 isoform 1 [Pan troglodytes]